MKKHRWYKTAFFHSKNIVYKMNVVTFLIFDLYLCTFFLIFVLDVPIQTNTEPLFYSAESLF